MDKNRLFEILATKSFSKRCKSGSIKLSFLTKTANFSITKFQQWLQLITQFQGFLHPM